MKLKKIIQGILLVLLVPLLSGWKWADVSHNTEVLDLNPICGYSGSSSNKDEMGFQSLAFEVESSGIYIRYDGKNERQVLVDVAKNTRMKHSFYITTENDYYEKALNYENFNMNTYLNYIKNNNACPANVFVCQDGKNYKMLNSIDSNSTCFSFKNTSSNIKDIDKNSTCSVANATCKRYTLKDAENKSLFIELGVEKNGSKYYAVAYNSTFRDAHIIRQKDGYTGTLKNGNVFQLMDTYIINANAFPDTIYVKPVTTDYVNYKYFIYRSKETADKDDNSGSSNKNCYEKEAVDCRRYSYKDNAGNNVGLEIGEIKKNNKTDHYFLLTYDNYSTVTKAANSYSIISINGDSYTIEDMRVFDRPYGDINISFSNKSGANGYFITRKGVTSDYGDNDIDVTPETPSETPPDEPGNLHPGTELDVPIGNTDPTEFCVDTSPIWQFVGYIFFILKILIPVIIIVLGIIDLFKVVTSNDEKAINKATMSVVQRLIMGIAIFFVPTLVSFMFTMLKDAVSFLEAAEACQTCLLRPTGDACKAYKEQSNASRKGGNS